MPGYVRVLYVDLALLNWAADLTFDVLLLWATAAACRRRTRFVRLLAGAAVGNAYFIAAFLSANGLAGPFPWLHSPWLTLAVPAAMLAAAFGPAPVKVGIGLAGRFYAIAFLSGGAGLAAGYAFAGEAGALIGRAVSVVALLAVAELGWGIVSHQARSHLYRFQLIIEMGGRQVRVAALLDTGNRLRDPLTHTPVTIVEAAALYGLFPDEMKPAVEALAAGRIEAAGDIPPGAGWAERIRLIPYRSLGQAHGILAGFRPDALYLEAGGRRHRLSDSIAGIYGSSLDEAGGYQALLHPALLDGLAPLNPSQHFTHGQGGEAIAIARTQG